MAGIRWKKFNTQLYGDLMFNYNKDISKDLKLSGIVGGALPTSVSATAC